MELRNRLVSVKSVKRRARASLTSVYLWVQLARISLAGLLRLKKCQWTLLASMRLRT